MRARDPARLETIVAEVRGYWQTLRRLGVRDPWALELTAPRVGTLAAAIAKLVIAAPLAALGAVMGWIPYRLAGWIAPRVTQDEDILSTVKLFAGALFSFSAGRPRRSPPGGGCGALWALPTFVLGVAGGYVALRFEELLRDGVAGWRAVSLRACTSRRRSAWPSAAARWPTTWRARWPRSPSLSERSARTRSAASPRGSELEKLPGTKSKACWA